VRRLLFLAPLLLPTGLALADGVGCGSDIAVIVPLLPSELSADARTYGRGVPNTVTINGAPYICDVDDERFGERDAFVAHLRMTHRVPAESIPGRLVLLEGRVHYIGE